MQTKPEKSHIALLKAANINVPNITNDTVENVLNNLRTSKNKQISDNYKISVLRTIKKLNNNITKKPKNLKLKALRSVRSQDVDGTKIIINVIKNIYKLSTNEIKSLETRSIIDAYIAILITSSCFMCIQDLYLLTETDLNNLIVHNTINKTKKITINVLFHKAQPLIGELLNHRNTMGEYKTSKLISCSSNLINRTIKTICVENASVYITKNDEDLKKFLSSVGVSKFRFKQPDILYNLI
ncbi:VLF-1 [Callinectes sapidus nudivirus]|nr:VLF-1 [Callinectes sapidus nudivirus]